MSLSFGSNKTKSTNSNTFTPNPAVTGLYDPTFQTTKNLINQPLTPYTGELAPGLSAGQQQAAQMVNAGIGTGQPAVAQGIAAAGGLTGYSAPHVTAPTVQGAQVGSTALSGSYGYGPTASYAQQAGPAAQAQAAHIDPNSVSNVHGGLLSNTDLQPYMDPYMNSVVSQTNKFLAQQNAQQIAQQQGQFTQGGAFGGSREGVADALTNQFYGQNLAQTDAGLLSQGYQNAQAQAQMDLNRGLTAQQSNQGTQLALGSTNAGLTQGANITNAGAQNQIAQTNAGLGTSANLASAQAANAAGQFGAQGANTASLANAGALNQTGTLNAQLGEQTGLTQAGLSQGAQVANQGANLAGAQIQLGSAGLLGNLGGQQQTMNLADVNAVNALGTQAQQTQAAQDKAAYNNYLMQLQYPFMQAQANTGLLGTLPAMQTLAGSYGTGTSSQSGFGFGLTGGFSSGGGMNPQSMAAFAGG